MAYKQAIQTYELLDSAIVNGEIVKKILMDEGLEFIETKEIEGHRGSTDFIKVLIPGKSGKYRGGNAPPLG